MKIKLINKAGYHSKIENQNGNYIDIDNKSDINPKGCLLYTSDAADDS